MKKKYNYRKPIIKSYELRNEEIGIGTETKSEKRFLCFKSIREIIHYILKTIFN